MARPKLSVNIYLDSAAIEDYPATEIALMLDNVAGKVAIGQLDGYCSDSNGNTVGQWSITNVKRGGINGKHNDSAEL